MNKNYVLGRSDIFKQERTYKLQVKRSALGVIISLAWCGKYKGKSITEL
jgi:hypothetical protein